MNSITSNAALEITNLLYRYCELMDGGRLEDVAALFRHARVKVLGFEALAGEAEMLALWRRHVIIYPDGTPRTKHLVSNPIVAIDEAANRATVRSYYSVYQATDGFPLQLIGAGRYHDEFGRHEGCWRFTFRDYTLFDLRGDLSRHLKAVE